MPEDSQESADSFDLDDLDTPAFLRKNSGRRKNNLTVGSRNIDPKGGSRSKSNPFKNTRLLGPLEALPKRDSYNKSRRFAEESVPVKFNPK